MQQGRHLLTKIQTCLFWKVPERTLAFLKIKSSLLFLLLLLILKIACHAYTASLVDRKAWQELRSELEEG
jgi:hypothetical protein